MAAPSEDMKLSDIFEKIWKNYQQSDESEEETNSPNLQLKISESIELAEKAVHMVNDLGLFSTNEHIDEVTTNELKYLLLPAMLGQLMMKSSQPVDRFESMQKAQIYLIDFIRLLRLYDITQVELPKPFTTKTASDNETDDDTIASAKKASATQAADLEAQKHRRHTKVERFRRQKVLRQDLKALYDAVHLQHVDEDVKRKYYLMLLDKWLVDSLDSLDTLDVELNLLHEMSKLGGIGRPGNTDSKKHSHKVSHQSTGVLRPFIITKDDVQKQVYGIGYPSIPTFTVDQFYQQRVDQGIFPDPTHGAGPVVITGDPEEEAARERERKAALKEENETDNDVKNARDWDDWKDDHRRGWGNTHNKG
jgi:immunoglobulin-binding protein 1